MLNPQIIFDPAQVDARNAARFGSTPLANEEAIGPDDLPGDWRVEWEERAAIMEYDGGLPRERAEALALTDVLQRMRLAASATAVHPPRSGGAEQTGGTP